MTKIEWLLNHGYKPTDLTKRGFTQDYTKDSNYDYIQIIDLERTDCFVSAYDDYPVFREKDAKDMLKVLEMAKKDYEQMIKECEDV